MDDAPEEYYTVIREGLRSYAKEVKWNLKQPQHTIQIKHDLTDGPIPGLSFDYENFRLTCDWRQLLTIFYAEIQMTTKTMEGWVKSQEGRMQGLRALSMDNGGV